MAGGSVSTGMFVAVFLAAVSVSAIATPLAIPAGYALGRGGQPPGGRRSHKGNIVRMGGLGLFPAFLVAALIPVLLRLPRQDPLELVRLRAVLLGMGVVWGCGLLDDRYNLPAWVQFVAMVGASLVAVSGRVFVEVFNEPFGGAQVWVGWYVMLPLSLLWISGMTATVNWLDGLDGLATGVTAIASTVLFIHMLRLGQTSVALLPLALVGVCIGFLPFNVSPARIFLGGGAYVLGYALGTLSIVAGAKVASALLVLWLPILDLMWQVYCRWRRGQSVAMGDRGHLHMRLQDMGWPTRRILVLYYSITALLGAVALVDLVSPAQAVGVGHCGAAHPAFALPHDPPNGQRRCVGTLTAGAIWFEGVFEVVAALLVNDYAK